MLLCYPQGGETLLYNEIVRLCHYNFEVLWGEITQGLLRY